MLVKEFTYSNYKDITEKALELSKTHCKEGELLRGDKWTSHLIKIFINDKAAKTVRIKYSISGKTKHKFHCRNAIRDIETSEAFMKVANMAPVEKDQFLLNNQLEGLLKVRKNRGRGEINSYEEYLAEIKELTAKINQYAANTVKYTTFSNSEQDKIKMYKLLMRIEILADNVHHLNTIKN